MNHELRVDQGSVRRHGQAGAFVSRLELDQDGRVLEGRDWITQVRYYNYTERSRQAVWDASVRPAGAVSPGHTAEFSRFCSGFLSEPGQLEHGSRGYSGQIYFANEETGEEGRVFGVVEQGEQATAYQLPRLGLFSWENTVVAPTKGRSTVVLGNEDAGEAQLRVYSGTKTRSAEPVAAAGLDNGELAVIDVAGVNDATENATFGVAGTTRPFSLSGVEWDASGAQQNAEARAKGTTFNRIEDGAFDPANRDDYYFVTTEGGDTTPHAEGGAKRDGGGVWRLRFRDVDRLERGGELTLLLTGAEAPYLNKPDNVTIDRDGNMLIQEDPGGNEHLARIVAYRIADGALATVAQFDGGRFSTGAAGFLTIDEESSGIIELADGSYLFDAQIHTPNPEPGAVEFGQLLSMTVQDWDDVYGSKAGHVKPRSR